MTRLPMSFGMPIMICRLFYLRRSQLTNSINPSGYQSMFNKKEYLYVSLPEQENEPLAALRLLYTSSAFSAYIMSV